MSDIKRFAIKKLRNHELLMFVRRVLEIIDGVYDGSPCPYADALKKALADFEAAVTVNDAAKLPLERYDAANDDVWTAIYYHLKSLLLHRNEEIKRAADETWTVFEQIPNPTRLPYDEEVSQLTVLFKRLSALPPKTRSMARLDEWLDMLRTSLDEFNEAAREQIDIKSQYQTGANRLLRNACILEWTDLSSRINAILLLGLDDKMIDAVPKLNTFIDKLSARLRARASRLSHEPEDPDIDFGAVS